MTITPPEGCISKAEEKLRNMLAACSAFQAWAGVATAADAKARIHLVQHPQPSMSEETDGVFAVDELKDLRPYAIIWTGETQAFSLDIIASPATPSQSGTLYIRLEENIADELRDRFTEAYRRFINTVGKIIHSEDSQHPGMVELLARCAPDYLAFHNISLMRHMRTTDDDVPTLGDAQMVELEVRWGATA